MFATINTLTSLDMRFALTYIQSNALKIISGFFFLLLQLIFETSKLFTLTTFDGQNNLLHKNFGYVANWIFLPISGIAKTCLRLIIS